MEGLAVRENDGSPVVTTGLADAVVEPQNEGRGVGGQPIREVEGRPARRGGATVACTHATFVTGPRPPYNARGYRPRIRATVACGGLKPMVDFSNVVDAVIGGLIVAVILGTWSRLR